MIQRLNHLPSIFQPITRIWTQEAWFKSPLPWHSTTCYGAKHLITSSCPSHVYYRFHSDLSFPLDLGQYQREPKKEKKTLPARENNTIRRQKENLNWFCLVLFLFLLLTLFYMSPFLPSLPTSTQPHLPFPSGHHHTVVCVCAVHVLWLIPSPSLIQPFLPLPADNCQSVPCVHASISILFISLSCSLDSTYKWDHMVTFSHQLTYFTCQNTLQVHPYCQKR